MMRSNQIWSPSMTLTFILFLRAKKELLSCSYVLISGNHRRLYSKFYFECCIKFWIWKTKKVWLFINEWIFIICEILNYCFISSYFILYICIYIIKLKFNCMKPYIRGQQTQSIQISISVHINVASSSYYYSFTHSLLSFNTSINWFEL